MRSRCPGGDGNRLTCEPGQISLSRFVILASFGNRDRPSVSAQCMQIQKPGIPPMCDGGYCAVGPNWRFFEGVSVPVAQKRRNGEPGQRNLARYTHKSIDVVTRTSDTVTYIANRIIWQYATQMMCGFAGRNMACDTQQCHAVGATRPNGVR